VEITVNGGAKGSAPVGFNDFSSLDNRARQRRTTEC
jgi:hypothetical protein